MRPNLSLAAVFWLALSSATAPHPHYDPQLDQDGDGIRDFLEGPLGLDPDSPERPVMIHLDPDEEELGESGGCLDFTKIWCCNVAGDRWLWIIDFEGTALPTGNKVFLLLDYDDDPSTGQQGGADIIYRVINWKADEQILNTAVRRVKSGDARYAYFMNSLYICDDIDLPKGDARAEFRFRVATEKGAQQDSMSWKTARVRRERSRPKPPIEEARR